MRIGLNLLGINSTRNGGTGFLAAVEAHSFERSGEDLRVLASQHVHSELNLPKKVRVVAEGHERGVTEKLRGLFDPYGWHVDSVASDAFDDREIVYYPFGTLAAPRHSGASVVCGVDLQHKYFPRHFSRKERYLRAIRWDRSLRLATRVTAYSEVVKESLIERLALRPELVDVVGATCDQRFFERYEGMGVAGREELLLYPASPLPHKNHGRLLSAFAAVSRRYPDVKLVLVGPESQDWTAVLTEVENQGLGDLVEIRGYVSVSELISLYRQARGLVFPSTFEGFGLPVLEAAAVGCPVTCADIPSLREIIGDAAIVFDPLEEEAIEGAIVSLLTATDEERSRLISAARERAQLFAPERMTASLGASFRKAVAMVQSER